MALEIRKLVNFEEEIFIEGFKKADTPWRMFAVAAVITNPWAGRYVEDLNPEVRAYGPVLGELMTKRIIAMAAENGEAGGDVIEAYGKLPLSSLVLGR